MGWTAVLLLALAAFLAGGVYSFAKQGKRNAAVILGILAVMAFIPAIGLHLTHAADQHEELVRTVTAVLSPMEAVPDAASARDDLRPRVPGRDAQRP